MQKEDAFYYLALKRVPGLGNVTARRLLERFGTAHSIFRASREELLRVRGVRPEAAAALRSFTQEGSVREELEHLRSLAVSLVCWHHDDYPPALKTIHDPPPCLYVRGELTREDRTAVAVVGTRTPTHYGIEMTRYLCKGLIRHGVTIVSGLARGIDTAAHDAALEFSGRTVAVLGCGVDVVYPPENRGLYRSIPRSGAVVSEFPPGAKPEPHHFPIRNRIISGLSLGVMVVEAAEVSGSLITARLAADQGREVFAVPGSLNSSKSKGANSLIQRGAKLVTEVDDILSELGRPLSPVQPEREEVEWTEFSDRETKILNLLGPDPVHFDELVRGSGMSVPEVSGCLLTLMLKGVLDELAGKLYVKKMGV